MNRSVTHFLRMGSDSPSSVRLVALTTADHRRKLDGETQEVDHEDYGGYSLKEYYARHENHQST